MDGDASSRTQGQKLQGGLMETLKGVDNVRVWRGMADGHLDRRIAGEWSPGELEPLLHPVFPVTGQVKVLLEEILERVTDEFNMPELMARVEEHSPYVVVAFQECERMNILTREIRRSLRELDLGLKVRWVRSWWEGAPPEDTAGPPGERGLPRTGAPESRPRAI